MIIGLIAFNFHYDIPELLEHWLRKYAAEFDEIILVLLAHSGPVSTDRVSRCLSTYANVRVYKNQITQASPDNADLARNALFFEIATAADMHKNWLCPSDIDEFTQWPISVKHTLRQADASGSNTVMGELCDRVTPDGEPAPITVEDPLAVFTKEWRLTDYEKRQTWKTLAVKNGVVFTRGNHQAMAVSEAQDEVSLRNIRGPRLGHPKIRIFNETHPLRVEHISWHAQRLAQLAIPGFQHTNEAVALHKTRKPPLAITVGGLARIRFASIRATNICNFHCTGCVAMSPTVGNKRKIDYDATFVNLALLGRLADLREVHIAGGEPFILSNIGEFVQRCYDAAPTAHKADVVTNAALLLERPERIRELPTSFPIQLIVSMHPELLNKYNREEIYSRLLEVGSLSSKNITIVVRDVEKFCVASFSARSRLTTLPECRAIKYKCTNVTHRGISTCDRTNPDTFDFDFEMSPEARAAAESAVLPLSELTSPRNVYDWWHSVQEVCHYCSGDEMQVRHNPHKTKSPHLEGDLILIKQGGG